MSSKTVPTRPRRLTPDMDFFDAADVVVVGLGGAGASAAIEAADNGAEVLVLEAASAGGGTTAMAGGLIYMGGGTPTQKACGIEDSVEDMYNYLLVASGPNADPARVRLYADGSLAHYDWLIAQGMEFKPEYYAAKHTNTPNDEGLIYTGNEACVAFREIARAAPRGHKGKAWGEDGGKMLMEKLIDSATRKGVRIRCDARALTAIVDDAGAVVGVVARIDGEERNIRARRGVVLCAGGFIMNTDMVNRHAPWLASHTVPNGNPNDNGMGIRIGMGAGGAAVNMHEGFACLPFYPPAGLVEGIMINGSGQRFINEDCYHGRMGEAILRNYPDKHYLVFDSRLFGCLEKPPLGNFRVVATGETVEELERELALPEGTLVFTIDFFNRHARKGEDPLFRKHADYLVPLDEPPYAACEVTPGTGAFYAVFTLGGLHALPTGEVLTEDNVVIPGLFTAGRNCCGLPRAGMTYSSGMSIGDATFFGRLAGRSAALRQTVWRAEAATRQPRDRHMPDINVLTVSLLVVTGFAAGVINTLAGGGSNLTIPALMVMGLPADVANATNRVGVLLQSVAGVRGFRRYGKLDSQDMLPVLVPNVLGGLLGAVCAAAIPVAFLKPLLLGTMVGMSLLILLRPAVVAPPAGTPALAVRDRPLAWASLFLAGVYGGFVQAGVGFILIAALAGTLRYDLVRTNALKMLCTAAFTLIALAVFVADGLVLWVPGLILGASTMVGAALGVRLAIKARQETLKWFLFVMTVCASAAALLK